MKTEVSVIIPFYNVEKYIDECIVSLIHQSYTNCEFIFINDASTDGSPEMVKKHQEKESRIKMVTLSENRFPGYARNLGMEMAKGKYILFVDSDDYLIDNTIELLITRLKEYPSDILIYNGRSFSEISTHTGEDRYFNLNKELFSGSVNWLDNPDYLCSCVSPCLKIYNLDFLFSNNINFPTGVYGEDVAFWLACLMNEPRLDYLDFTGYNRRYREGSIMTGDQVKNTMDRINSLDYLLRITSSQVPFRQYVINNYIPYITRLALGSNNREVKTRFFSVLRELRTKYRF